MPIFFLFLFQFYSPAFGVPGLNIENFKEVTEGKIYRGARPALEDITHLHQLGFRTFINLQGGDRNSLLYGSIASWLEPGEDPQNIQIEKEWVKDLGMNFWHAPLNSFDAVSKHDSILIDKTLEIMANPKAHPIYIHCEHGKDRTGLLVALYRVKYEKWEIADAYQEWVESGHGLLLILSDELDTYFFKKVVQIYKNQSSFESHP